MEEQLDELEEQLREQRLEDLIFEQGRREASEAMQEQLEAMTTDGNMSPRRRHRRDVVTATIAIVYRHCRWRISVLHVLNILYVFLNHLCFE